MAESDASTVAPSGAVTIDRDLGRAMFHMIAVTTASIYYYTTDTVGAVVLLLLGTLFILLDVGRIRSPWFRSLVPRFVLRMVRGCERTRLSAITHFVLAATLIDAIYLTVGLDKSAVLAATMFVAFGDPLARLVGMSVGSPRLWGTNRTLAGSTAFFVTGVTMASLVGWTFGATLSWLQLLVGGALLTAIEVASGKYDNFYVTFLGSLVMMGLGAVSAS